MKIINTVRNLYIQKANDILVNAVYNSPSLVFNHVVLTHNIALVTLKYLTQTCQFRKELGGGAWYDISTVFIPKEGIVRWVPVRNPRGGVRVFLYKNTPIVFTNGTDDNEKHGILMYYIAGTLDVEQLLCQATNHIMAVQPNESRFRIRRFGGMSSSTKRVISVDDIDSVQSVGSVEHDYIGVDLTPVDTKEKNPFDSVALCENTERMVNECRYWMSAKTWHQDRDLPWQLSVMIYGKPGTGKTSTIRALAKDLNIPIIIMDLTTMDNEDLTRAWSSVMSHVPCIVLFEDIDRLFNEKKDLDTSKTRVTLDALLNTMNGVEESSGIITIMTANHLDNIDPAVLRPGRTDIFCEVGLLDEAGRRKIVNRILAGMDSDIEEVMSRSNGMTGAEITRMCQEIAVKRFWEKSK